jgi:hypothetical protein
MAPPASDAASQRSQCSPGPGPGHHRSGSGHSTGYGYGGGQAATKRGVPSDAGSPAGSGNDLADGRADGGTADGKAPKKRRMGPGSRGVANLTPEQLEKKRANGGFSCFLLLCVLGILRRLACLSSQLVITASDTLQLTTQILPQGCSFSSSYASLMP